MKPASRRSNNASCVTYFSTLKIEAVRSSETSVVFYGKALLAAGNKLIVALCLINYHAMKRYGRMETTLQSFLASDAIWS
jgi:hypothetical protein